MISGDWASGVDSPPPHPTAEKLRPRIDRAINDGFLIGASFWRSNSSTPLPAVSLQTSIKDCERPRKVTADVRKSHVLWSLSSVGRSARRRRVWRSRSGWLSFRLATNRRESQAQKQSKQWQFLHSRFLTRNVAQYHADTEIVQQSGTLDSRLCEKSREI